MSSLGTREFGQKQFEPKQRATKSQVNAEEMLAELKRVLESSAFPGSVPPPSASMVSKFISFARGRWRSQIGKGSDPPMRAAAADSVKSGQPIGLQLSIRARSLRWKLTAAGLALAGAAMICASVALVKETPNSPRSELSVVATEEPVRPQSGETSESKNDAGSLTQDIRPTEHLQVGNVETQPDPIPLPPNSSPLPAGEKEEVDAPHPTALASAAGTAATAFTPAPASPAVAPAPAAPPTVKPDETLIATASSAPASTDSALPAETPKPQANAIPATSPSTASPRPSTPKIDPTRRPSGKTSQQKPAKSAKTSAKPVAQAERQSPRPAPPNEAAASPPPAQAAGNPTPLAPAPAPTIQQRVADGVTNAFGYVMHLPGALMPHPADPSAAGN